MTAGRVAWMLGLAAASIALAGCSQAPRPGGEVNRASAFYFLDATSGKPVREALVLPTYGNTSVASDGRITPAASSSLGFPFICRTGHAPMPAHEPPDDGTDWLPYLGVLPEPAPRAAGAIFLAPGYRPIASWQIPAPHSPDLPGTLGPREYVVKLEPAPDAVEDLMAWIALLGKDRWGGLEASRMPVLQDLGAAQIANRLEPAQRQWVRDYLTNAVLQRPGGREAMGLPRTALEGSGKLGPAPAPGVMGLKPLEPDAADENH